MPEVRQLSLQRPRVACGPPGLQGGKNILFHNNGDGTFTDVSEKAGILKTPGTYGLGVLVADFDNDGWPDIYVANDSDLFRAVQEQSRRHVHRYRDRGRRGIRRRRQAAGGHGRLGGGYDCDGRFDIVKTNFAGDASSLYRNLGDWFFEDTTFQAGLGRNTRFLGWGACFLDFDNDGWPDILLVQRPRLSGSGARQPANPAIAQRKVLYRNLGNGKFEDVSPTPARASSKGSRVAAVHWVISITMAISISW